MSAIPPPAPAPATPTVVAATSTPVYAPPPPAPPASPASSAARPPGGTPLPPTSPSSKACRRRQAKLSRPSRRDVQDPRGTPGPGPRGSRRPGRVHLRDLASRGILPTPATLQSSPPPPPAGSGRSLGSLFLDSCLRDFSSPVVKPLSPSSPMARPVVLWAVHSISPRVVRARSVAAVLTFWFSIPSQRFAVRARGPGVFSFSVACPAVAAAILRLGALLDRGIGFRLLASKKVARQQAFFQNPLLPPRAATDRAPRPAWPAASQGSKAGLYGEARPSPASPASIVSVSRSARVGDCAAPGALRGTPPACSGALAPVPCPALDRPRHVGLMAAACQPTPAAGDVRLPPSPRLGPSAPSTSPSWGHLPPSASTNAPAALLGEGEFIPAASSAPPPAMDATVLREALPALFSHCLDADVTVAEVMAAGGLGPADLQPRLSTPATSELVLLHDALHATAPQPRPDTRWLKGCRSNDAKAGDFYAALRTPLGAPPLADINWDSFAPKKVKVFF
ncbi:hypothetical protein HU200_038365 [Digitaria exilis]|uniref:Uncharacterized protein n=1 Tax=Digitaria exilis TaxID=1010633 RepID=A0A835EJ91_9POAL|nr:hypothetical protein HU200_038365 [Digitaria exilis]